MTVAKAPKAKARAPAPAAVREAVIAGRSRSRYDEILALQRTVGNRAVNGLLQRQWASRAVPSLLQAQLRIAPVLDPCEQEADAIAVRLVSTSATEPQRVKARTPSYSSLLAEAPGIVADILRSPGHSLEAGIGAEFEARLGADFGRVRLHTDTQAGRSAAAIGARAYTIGHHVVFASGEYAPGTPAGKRLLAHELAHVLQQSEAADRTRSFVQRQSDEPLRFEGLDVSRTQDAVNQGQLGEAVATVTAEIVGKAKLSPYPTDNLKFYEVPLYKMILRGTQSDGTKIGGIEFDVILWGVALGEPKGNTQPYLCAIPAGTYVIRAWKPGYARHGAWVLTNNFYLHAGSAAPQTRPTGAIGCIELTGAQAMPRFQRLLHGVLGIENDSDIAVSGKFSIVVPQTTKPPLKEWKD